MAGTQQNQNTINTAVTLSFVSIVLSVACIMFVVFLGMRINKKHINDPKFSKERIEKILGDYNFRIKNQEIKTNYLINENILGDSLFVSQARLNKKQYKINLEHSNTLLYLEQADSLLARGIIELYQAKRAKRMIY